MKCSDVEQAILDNKINEHEENHISTCSSCQMYLSLLSHHIPMDIDYSIDKQDAIKKAFEASSVIEKKHNILMLIVFIFIASTIVTSLAYLSINFNLLKYTVFMSAIMPLTLPLIFLVKRKEATHGN